MTALTIRVNGQTVRVPPRLPNIPPRPIHLDCICPGCYWVATEGEMCLRCTLDGCTAQENHHG